MANVVARIMPEKMSLLGRIQLEIYREKKALEKELKPESIIDHNPNNISWSRSLKQSLNKFQKKCFDNNSIYIALYRPYTKQKFYFNRDFNECVYQQPLLFPKPESKNLVITAIGIGEDKEYSVLISDSLIELKTLYNCKCFPLYYFEGRPLQSPTLFDVSSDSEYIRRDGISDFILERAKKQYGKNVTKEDIFYYVYGILHSPDYRTAFANDLKKMLPRIPLLEDVRDFWKFSKAGKQLAELHVNYEKVPPFESVMVKGVESGFFKVEKMRFPKKGQKDTIIYNSRITICNIPEKAYEYVVNGKSAIEWIMERYQVKVDKASGIKNDPNDWANEVGNPRYILDLLLGVASRNGL